MISHNKFLSFLITCMITNSCFAIDPIYAPWTGYINPHIAFTFLNGCPRNSYVATCGDTTLDLNTISSLIATKNLTDCWNMYTPYENMHKLLNLSSNTSNDYTLSEDVFNNDTCQSLKESLTQFRADIYNTCLSSYTCIKCPNNGITDTESKIQPAVTGSETGVVTTPAYWKSFNTIADCYTVTGSDNTGTYELKDENAKCYYSY